MRSVNASDYPVSFSIFIFLLLERALLRYGTPFVSAKFFLCSSRLLYFNGNDADKTASKLVRQSLVLGT